MKFKNVSVTTLSALDAGRCLTRIGLSEYRLISEIVWVTQASTDGAKFSICSFFSSGGTITIESPLEKFCNSIFKEFHLSAG